MPRIQKPVKKATVEVKDLYALQSRVDDLETDLTNTNVAVIASAKRIQAEHHADVVLQLFQKAVVYMDTENLKNTIRAAVQSINSSLNASSIESDYAQAKSEKPRAFTPVIDIPRQLPDVVTEPSLMLSIFETSFTVSRKNPSRPPPLEFMTMRQPWCLVSLEDFPTSPSTILPKIARWVICGPPAINIHTITPSPTSPADNEQDVATASEEAVPSLFASSEKSDLFLNTSSQECAPSLSSTSNTSSAAVTPSPADKTDSIVTQDNVEVQTWNRWDLDVQVYADSIEACHIYAPFTGVGATHTCAYMTEGEELGEGWWTRLNGRYEKWRADFPAKFNSEYKQNSANGLPMVVVVINRSEEIFDTKDGGVKKRPRTDEEAEALLEERAKKCARLVEKQARKKARQAKKAAAVA